MSSLSLKSKEGEGTGAPVPAFSLFFSSTTRGTASSSPSGRKSANSSAGRSNCGKRQKDHIRSCLHALVKTLRSFSSLTAMAVSWFPVLGMVLFGTVFLCTRGGLPSGLASALLFDKLSLLISFSSLGISSLNLRASQNGHRLW